MGVVWYLLLPHRYLTCAKQLSAVNWGVACRCAEADLSEVAGIRKLYSGVANLLKCE